MNSRSPVGPAVIRRSFDRQRNVIFAVGELGGLLQAYEQHVRRWESTPDPLVTTMMHQGLAAAALHVSSRPRDELIAWTLNVQTPPLNLFLAGDAGEGSVTGRAYVEGVKPAAQSLLYVQSSRARMATTNTVLPVAGLDLLDIFEEYHRQSVQSAARYFEHDDARYSMAYALPDHDREWLAALDRDALLREAESAAPLDVRHIRFSCGCTAEKLVEIMRALPAAERDWIFADQEMIEAHCPRCGHRWRVSRREV